MGASGAPSGAIRGAPGALSGAILTNLAWCFQNSLYYPRGIEKQLFPANFREPEKKSTQKNKNKDFEGQLLDFSPLEFSWAIANSSLGSKFPPFWLEVASLFFEVFEPHPFVEPGLVSPNPLYQP